MSLFFSPHIFCQLECRNILSLVEDITPPQQVNKHKRYYVINLSFIVYWSFGHDFYISLELNIMT